MWEVLQQSEKRERLVQWMDARERCCNVWGEVLQRICCNVWGVATNGRGGVATNGKGWCNGWMDGSCCNNATDGREALQQTVGKVLHSRGGVATDGRKVLQQVQRNGRGALQQTVGEVLHGRGGVATDGRKALQQMGGRRCNTAEVLQQMVRRCCNKWESECNGTGGVATNRRGEMGKMQQDVAIFHGGWTTVNDATAIYGSYRESCNKVPCTLRSIVR